MPKEINPLEVAFVEKDIDVGGYFVYLDSDLRDRLTEPVGHIISARVYSRLVSTYGIPNVNDYSNGKRKDIKKIQTILSKLGPQQRQQQPPPPIQEEIDPIPLSHTDNIDGGSIPVIPHTHASNGGVIPTVPSKKIGGLINRPLIPLQQDRTSPPDTVEMVDKSTPIDSKVCPCGHTMLRTDYPNMLDVNWDSKKYCSKQCARKYRKQS